MEAGSRTGNGGSAEIRFFGPAGGFAVVAEPFPDFMPAFGDFRDDLDVEHILLYELMGGTG